MANSSSSSIMSRYRFFLGQGSLGLCRAIVDRFVKEPYSLKGTIEGSSGIYQASSI